MKLTQLQMKIALKELGRDPNDRDYIFRHKAFCSMRWLQNYSAAIYAPPTYWLKGGDSEGNFWHNVFLWDLLKRRIHDA